MERHEIEQEIGDAELIEEALRTEEIFSTPPQPNTPRRSRRSQRSQRQAMRRCTQSSVDEGNASNAVFMPKPGMNVTLGISGTPLEDKPGPSRQRKSKKGKGPVNSFTAPRKK